MVDTVARCPEPGGNDGWCNKPRPCPKHDVVITTPENIDNRIDDWHNGEGPGQQLHEYLGWTREQYSDWVEQGKFPDATDTTTKETTMADNNVDEEHIVATTQLQRAQAIGHLVGAGFTRTSVRDAIVEDDFSRLESKFLDERA